jgi:hypothetical protein
MTLVSKQAQDAQDFIETVEAMVSSKDDVIYNLYTDVKRPNMISPSTVGNRDAIIEISLYNVADPNEFFTTHQLLRLGELGADVDMQKSRKVSGPLCSIEIFNRFK